MSNLEKTKTQLEELGEPWVGMELMDGSKHFGPVDKFTKFYIYFKDKNGDVLDVPRRIIKRAFLLIKGGKEE